MTPEPLGILVVHNDPVPEAEIWRAMPPGAEVITGRFRLNRKPGAEYARETARDFLTPQVAHTIRDLASAGAKRIALCFLSASAFGGEEFDAALPTLVKQECGIELFTAGTALTEELARIRAARILVMAPPWFTDRNVDTVVNYLETKGTSLVAGRCRFELSSTWQGARQDLFDSGAMNAIPSTELATQIERALNAHQHLDIDAVVVPGSGFRSIDATTEMLNRTGLPLISANSAVVSLHLAESQSAKQNSPQSRGTRTTRRDESLGRGPSHLATAQEPAPPTSTRRNLH